MGYFAIRGRLSSGGATAIKDVTASGLHQWLARSAEALGGHLVKLYFLSSDLTMLAILDIPAKGSMGLMIQLIASGGFENPVMERIETADEVDAALSKSV